MSSDQISLLVVDDDRDIRELLAEYLSDQGFSVFLAEDGKAMDVVLGRESIDLLVLDVMLPGEDGLSICRRIRARSTIPIVMLTAKGEDVERIIGIEMGADDYLAKPFNPRELVARIKAILWRASQSQPTEPSDEVYLFEGHRLNFSTRELTTEQGIHVALSSREFDLLATFVRNGREVMSRDRLLELTQGRNLDDPEDRSMDMLIARLRKKIEPDPGSPRFIKTVRGAGYTFTPSITRP